MLNLESIIRMQFRLFNILCIAEIASEFERMHYLPEIDARYPVIFDSSCFPTQFALIIILSLCKVQSPKFASVGRRPSGSGSQH